MKVKLYVVIFFLFLTAMLYSEEEIQYEIVNTSPYYSRAAGGAYYNQKHEGYLNSGEYISGLNRMYNAEMVSSENITLNIWFSKDNVEYVTLAENLIPAQSESLFPAYILTDFTNNRVSDGYKLKENEAFINNGPFKSVVSELWVPEYYGEILKSKNRDTWDDPRLQSFYDDHEQIFYNWYDIYSIMSGRYIFTNAGIGAGGGINFVIKNIKKTDYGYEVTCIQSTTNLSVNREHRFHWEYIPEDEFMKLLLYIEGDYIDMYINDQTQHFGTIMKVKSEFIRQFENLIKTNDCDLSKVLWPNRAAVLEDAIAYPPPVDMTNYKTTHITIDNLRLRETPNTSSLMVTTLNSDSAVQVLETGEMQTIDGITAPWVKVLSESGYTGWCFSGYLEEIPQNESVIIPVSTAIESNENTENAENTEQETIVVLKNDVSTPIIPFAVGGGIVVIGLGIVFLVKRKKKIP